MRQVLKMINVYVSAVSFRHSTRKKCDVTVHSLYCQEKLLWNRMQRKHIECQETTIYMVMKEHSMIGVEYT